MCSPEDLTPEEINPLERPLIQKIIDDECWLKGEKVHHEVSKDDPEIQLRVAEIVLTIGNNMRQCIALSCMR